MTLKGIQLRLKWGCWSLKDALGFPLRWKGRKGEVEVLCFHGLCEDHQPFINGRFFAVSAFETLVKTITEQAHILSLADFLAHRLHPEKLNVLLTFDDGYLNNRTLLLPIIERLAVPVTIFVTNKTDAPLWADLWDVATAHENKTNSMIRTIMDQAGVTDVKAIKQWLPQQDPRTVQKITQQLMQLPSELLEQHRVFWELLSEQDLSFLAKHPLVSLANHGAHHWSLLTLSDEEIAEEIMSVQERLKMVGSPYYSIFAYPFGHYSAATINQLARIGIQYQFLANKPENPLAFTIPRLTVNPFISVNNMLRSIQKGSY